MKGDMGTVILLAMQQIWPVLIPITLGWSNLEYLYFSVQVVTLLKILS